jgi:hypothetical protein
MCSRDLSDFPQDPYEYSLVFVVVPIRLHGPPIYTLPSPVHDARINAIPSKNTHPPTYLPTYLPTTNPDSTSKPSSAPRAQPRTMP